MTGNLIIDLAISAIAIGVMVAFAYFLFPSRPEGVTLDRARERLAFGEPDFAPNDWLIDDHARAALAIGVDDQVALIVNVGGDLASRRFERASLSVSLGAENLLDISTGDAMGRQIPIEADGAAQWARTHLQL